MLEFIYGFNYDAGPVPKITEKIQWARRVGLHVEVCLAGDKFGVPGLEEHARERMSATAKSVV